MLFCRETGFSILERFLWMVLFEGMADARDRRSEKMGMASAMTHAMMVKMITSTIHDAQPAGVLM